MSSPIGVLGAIWQFGGGACTVYYLYKLIGYGATSNYPQAVGTVLISQVRAKSAGTYDHAMTVQAARVEYEYEVAGRKYRNNVIDAGGSVWTSLSGPAEAVRRRYPEGSVVAVYYDPAHPDRSFLQRSPAALLIVLAGCVGVSIAGCIMRG